MSSFEDLEAGLTFVSRRSDYMNGRQDPTQASTNGVFQIQTSVYTFQRLVNTLGTPKDTPQHREKLRNTRLRIEQLVKDTLAKLKQASDTVQRPTERSKNAKLSKDFESILKEFQKAQRVAAEREVQYAPFVQQSSYVPSELDRNSDKKYPEQRTALTESDILLLDNDIVFNEAIIEEREQGIQEIQNQIGEISEIFKNLAVLVHEQKAGINDIDTHGQNSYRAIQQGKTQLEKAETQKSKSSLTCLVWVIFGLVLLILIIVLTV